MQMKENDKCIKKEEFDLKKIHNFFSIYKKISYFIKKDSFFISKYQQCYIFSYLFHANILY